MLKLETERELPIRNRTDKPLVIFVEVDCDQYEVPPGGTAIVTMEDGLPHRIDVNDQLTTVWNGGREMALVEIVPPRTL